jgi:hypothetical protein
MEKEQFALQIFESQDEREENQECFLDLLISKAILDSDDSDEFKSELHYWAFEIEKAINKAEDIEDDDGGTVYFQK